MLLGWVAAKIERAQVILTGVILLWERVDTIDESAFPPKGRKKKKTIFCAIPISRTIDCLESIQAAAAGS